MFEPDGTVRATLWLQMLWMPVPSRCDGHHKNDGFRTDVGSWHNSALPSCLLLGRFRGAKRKSASRSRNAIYEYTPLVSLWFRRSY